MNSYVTSSGEAFAPGGAGTVTAISLPPLSLTVRLPLPTVKISMGLDASSYLTVKFTGAPAVTLPVNVVCGVAVGTSLSGIIAFPDVRIIPASSELLLPSSNDASGAGPLKNEAVAITRGCSADPEPLELLESAFSFRIVSIGPVNVA